MPTERSSECAAPRPRTYKADARDSQELREVVGSHTRRKENHRAIAVVTERSIAELVSLEAGWRLSSVSKASASLSRDGWPKAARGSSSRTSTRSADEAAERPLKGCHEAEGLQLDTSYARAVASIADREGPGIEGFAFGPARTGRTHGSMASRSLDRPGVAHRLRRLRLRATLASDLGRPCLVRAALGTVWTREERSSVGIGVGADAGLSRFARPFRVFARNGLSGVAAP